MSASLNETIELGQSLHKARRFDAAGKAWRDAIERFPDSAAVHNGLGRTLNNTGDLAGAAQAFRRAVELDPAFVDAWHNLGHVLRRGGRLDEAAEAFSQALEVDAGHAGSSAQLGACLVGLKRYDEAARVLERATSQQPDRFDTWMNYGIALGALDRLDDAVAAFARARAVDPSEPALAGRLASALVRADRRDDAVALGREWLDRRPATPTPPQADAYWHLGEVLRAAGRLDLAIECYRVCASDPSNEARGQLYLGAALLENGDMDAAEQTMDRALALAPRWQSAIACKVALLEQQGRMDAATELLDLDRHVMTFQVEPPAAYADVAAFNNALAERVLAEPSLAFERAGNRADDGLRRLVATRLGRHSGALDIGSGGVLGDLADFINASARRYLDALPWQEGHPLLGFRPTSWSLHVWTVIMDRGGHQVAHTHDEGFLSGVYYPRLPAVMDDDDGSHAGWLEVGRPTDNLIGRNEPRVRLVRPTEGLLVVFPSYCFHRTIPFQADEPRISVAFDLRPTA